MSLDPMLQNVNIAKRKKDTNSWAACAALSSFADFLLWISESSQAWVKAVNDSQRGLFVGPHVVWRMSFRNSS